MNTATWIKIFSFVLLSGVFVGYTFLQPVLNYASCPLCDGNFYYQIYEWTKEKSIQIPKSPYQSRFLIPLLASVLPLEAKYAFWGIHLVFGLLSIYIVVKIWIKIHIRPIFIFFGVLWITLHWIGIFRHNIWDYIAVDSPVIAIHGLLVLILLEKKYKWAYPVCLLGIFIKESILPLLLASFVWALWNEQKIKESRHLLISAIMGFSLLSYTQNYLNPQSVSSVRIMAFHLKELIFEPYILLIWLVALFWAYGLGIWFAERKGLFYWLAVCYTIMGLLGGRDAARILFLGYPFIMTSILIGLEKLENKQAIILFLLSIPFLRLFELFPQEYGEEYLNFFPESAKSYQFIYFFGYPIAGSLILWQASKN